MPALLQELLQQPDLEVIVPTAPNWTDVRAMYVADNPAMPVAIARPKNATHIATFIRAAHAHAVKISVRSGGHDVFGRSVVDGALVIDMRSMNSIALAQDRSTATVAGGVLVGDLIKELTLHDLVTPFGYLPDIGYAGWSMMGGYGWFAPNYGLGTDQIVRAQVVTWQGDVIEADAELLKGIRGAGGNFGIIVELGVKVYPLDKVLAGPIVFKTTDMRETIHKYFSGYSALSKPRYGAASPFWYPDPQLGWVFSVNFVWSSPDLNAGKEYLIQLSKLGDTDVSEVIERTPAEWVDFFVPLVPNPVFGYDADNAVSFKTLSPKTVDVIADFMTKTPIDAANALLVHEMRGPSAQADAGSCFGTRFAHSVIELIGVAANASNHVAARDRNRALFDALRGTGEALNSTYVSLTQTRDTNVSQCFGDDWQFVMDLKNRYDPQGVFDETVPRLRP